MAQKTTLAVRPWQVAFAVAYALAFPLAQLFGGTVLMVALLVTMPFLLVGYAVGSALVWASGIEATYNVGVFMATLVQLWLLFAFWNARTRDHERAT